MPEIVGTTKRPIYPLVSDHWRYFSQISENGLWVYIYDNQDENRMIGKLALASVESMRHNFYQSEDENG